MLYVIKNIDVCYMWHAHCLSPLRYYEDIARLYNDKLLSYSFPLVKLNAIWTQLGSHTDTYSEKIWEQHTSEPWVLDPQDNSDFKIKCPWCKKLINIPS